MTAGRIRLAVILALLVLATAVPLLLFAGYLVVTSWRQQVAVVERQNVDTARAVSVAIDQEVESAMAALDVLAALPPVNPREWRGFRDIAGGLVGRRRGWHGLLVAERTGRVVLDTAATPSETPPSGTGWIDAVVATGRPAASDLFEDPSSRRRYLVIAVPVMRGDRVAFVLGARIVPDVLSDVVHRQNVPPNGVVTLIDGNRRILARTRNEVEFVGQPPSRGFLEASARMGEGSWRDVLLEGTPAYAALSRSPLTGWTVGLELPADEIDGAIWRSLMALAGAGVLVVAGGLGVAALVGRLLIRGLGSAAGSARSLAVGEPVAAQPSPVRELHDLSRALGDAAVIRDARLRDRDEDERRLSQAAAEREQALIAERAARAASLKDQARLSVTLQSIGDAVIATDPSGRVTMLNPVAQALTGWTESAALDQPIEQVFHVVDEATRLAVDNPVGRVFREGGVAEATTHALLIARDGREAPVEDSAAPIRAADGSLLGMVLVFRDVSARRQAERERLRLLEREQGARREAEALSRSKDEFVATVSHELRTPLNAILGWVRLSRSGSLDPAAQAHALEVIERNTRAQAQLVDDLLDISRVVTGNLRIETRHIDLIPVLEAAADAVRPSAKAKALTLTFTPERPAVSIMGDPDRVQQVVWNLLVNSVKFTPQNGRIDMRLGVEGLTAVVRVSDTGVGIAPELLPHVFDRFRQGNSSDTRTHSGLGLGLSLVRHLVDLHGGTVSADSEGEGRGATFTVRLPLAGERAAPAPPPPGPRAMPRSAQRHMRPAGHGVLERVHVLVVDDDPDARDLVSTALRQAGAEVSAAGGVDDALKILESETPDIVVSDIAMPNGTGYDLLRRVRSTARTAHLPVLALTAYSAAEDRERALRAGFDLHLGKPVEPNVLVYAVAAAAATAAHRA